MYHKAVSGGLRGGQKSYSISIKHSQESVNKEYHKLVKKTQGLVRTDSKDCYLASTSADAVGSARTAHPEKVFYIKKIGFDAVETMANLTLTHHDRR